ncbi:YciI family protein [Aspergillus ruber CBS 135680]|uniref:YCII-related domain-containing protein n=1 Tax=Aspergillus ruber (strain CBS 135680) TaxID=1388766 RepID=A0A017SQA5_ASPRC|nr:uncharacterized protein EURHEDRAFT_447269 [Aspergillus ruber CBS 135680]EYE99148.1 hypothetical protein EURHEDRAFT_447269 [Aspergillus ruber CBS 135680]
MSASSFCARKSALFTTWNYLSRVEFSPIRAVGPRTMATTTGKAKEFLCILPDKPNALDIRKKVRAIHYEEIKPLVEAERLVAGGAMLDKHLAEGEDPPFKGSMIVYTGESVEDAWEAINGDIYAKSGVWDLKRVQIIPYVSAIRKPMP